VFRLLGLHPGADCDTGDAGLARYHRRRALNLYAGLGAPEYGEMRMRLAELDQRDRGDHGDLVTL
jgi:hypothetical protein